jgi:hypothetical protein
MPLTREGTNVREYKIPAIYEAETTQQVKDIPRPVENAHAFLGTTTDGRLYKFDASSSAADDNYGTLQPSDTSWTGRWKLMPYGTAAGTGDFFNVKSFGATGDGTTDDSAAINAAIDAATGVGGGTVYFPYGTYRLLSAISSLNDRGVRLLGVYGDGLMTTGVGAVLVNDTGGAALNVNNAVVRGQSTVIERLAIIDGTTGGTYSIQLTGTYQVLVTNCAFETPLLLTSTRDTTIDRCYFTGTAGGYVQLSSAAIDTIIRDSNFDGSGGSSSCIASADSEITGLRLVNNQAVSLSGTFLGLTQASNKVTNLHIEGNHITSTTGETVTASKALIDLAGSFADAFDGVSIENNYFNWDAATYTWGIKGAYVNNSTFSNNRFDTAAITADISLDANSSNNYVVANGLSGSYSDSGTGNQFIDSSNALIGNKTQDYVNDRTNTRPPSNGVYFNGTTAVLTGSGSVSDIIGTSDFSIAWVMAYHTAANDDETIFDDGTLSVRISGAASDYVRVRIDGTDYIITTAITAHDEYKHYCVTGDRDGNATLYINGVASGTVDISAESATVLSGSTYKINNNSSTGINSTFLSVLVYDRLLDATEIDQLQITGNQPDVLDQWGTATEVLTDPGFEAWSSPSNLTSWTEGASITIAQDGVNKYSGSYACHYTSSGSSIVSGVLHQLRQSSIVPVGWNRASVIVKNAAAGVFDFGVNNDRWVTFDGTSLTDRSSEVIAEYPGSELRSYKLTDLGSGWYRIDLVFKLVASSARDFVLGGTGQWYIDDASCKPAGCALALLPENIESNGSIVDATSNELNATATNVTALQVKPQRSGTFTPELLFGGANTGMTYGNQTGYWRKLDEKTVYIDARITLTALGSSTGNATLGGMPFTAANRGLDHAVAQVAAFNMTGLALGGVSGVVTYNGTDIKLYESSATGLTTIDQTVFTATSEIRFSAVYEIA